MHAFVDESYTDSTYTFGVCLIEQRHMEHAREQMRSLLLPGQKKVHWTKENPKRHRLITDTISSLPVDLLAVARTSVVPERSERRRRLCLEVLVPFLEQQGVDTIVFESRKPSEDRHDIVLIEALRKKGWVGPDCRIEHLHGPAEPLLWIADAICGGSRRVDATELSSTIEVRQLK